MTSEVALLNRSAVALAADSATTVTYWEKDHYETRYFKGTNKIFHLSTVHPVGIMIYAAANLQGAPWDVLIKSYRDQLGTKSHDDLPAYATDLFDYIATNAHIFSAEVQEKQFKSDVGTVAARVVVPIVQHDDFKNATDDHQKAMVMMRGLADAQARIDAAAFVGNATQADIDGALSKFSNEIKIIFEQDSYYKQVAKIGDFDCLARIAISGLYKISFTSLNSSGIVIAGFGDKNYFPRLIAYRCFGLALGKLLLSEEQGKAQTMSQTNSSAVVPFAQDEMIRTFIYGTGVEALYQLDQQFGKAVDSLYDEMTKAGFCHDLAGDPTKIAELNKLKHDTKTKFSDAFLDYSIASHSTPLRRVLGSLPFDELAELAETLVLLESLKERVTRPSASVSGPIDVAVISKNDGFIWIKRKHYFDPKLNPRFFGKRTPVGST
jgi:hypothetical protein